MSSDPFKKGTVKAHLFSSWHIISKQAKYVLVFWFNHPHLMETLAANNQECLCRHLSLAKIQQAIYLLLLFTSETK